MSFEPSSLNAAASQISAMMEEPKEPTQEPVTQEPTEPQEPVEQAAQEPVEPQEPAEPKLGADTVEIEIDGEKYNVPAKLKDSFMKERDYRNKTQEIAKTRKEMEEERKTLASKVDQETKAELERYRSLLAHAIQEDSQTDWKALLESDPIEYLRRKELAEQRHRAFTEQQRKAQAEQQQQLQSKLTSEGEKLLAKLPEWKDEKLATEGKLNIAKYLQAEGFTSEEIGGIYDHRHVLMIEKARKYDELLKNKEAAVKKVEKAPPKVERPGSQNDAKPAKEAMQRLKKTGRMDDAVAAISQLMN